jgi:hypothetical protein
MAHRLGRVEARLIGLGAPRASAGKPRMPFQVSIRSPAAGRLFFKIEKRITIE